MSLEDRLRKALRSSGQLVPGPDCPGPDVIVSFLSGDRRKETVEHLAGCPSCREDLLVARGQLVSRPKPLAWFAAAAAVLLAIVAGAMLLLDRKEPQTALVLPPPKPKAAPKVEKPRAPEPPPPAPPAPQPVTSRPAPMAEVKPATRPESPKEPEKPLIAKPIETEIPKPVPRPEEKPAPPPTRAKLRGSLLLVAGACSTEAEGDAAWQIAKPAQLREFSGSVKLRAETSAAKTRMGAATYYLRGGTELTIGIEEGATIVRLDKGEAFFDVTPGKDTFVVQTANCKTTVRGTRFLVTPLEVAVQRGKVEFTAREKSVTVGAGERSVGAQPSERVELAKRLAWMRPLEETIMIKAETMAVSQGMAILSDPGASGGRAIGLKGAPVANAEPSAEIRIKRKQAAPHAVWIRLQWSHGVPPGFTVQVHDAQPWSGRDVVAKPGWQWARVGTFDLPDDSFRLRVVDAQGGLRFDEILVTTDLELNPETR